MKTRPEQIRERVEKTNPVFDIVASLKKTGEIVSQQFTLEELMQGSAGLDALKDQYNIICKRPFTNAYDKDNAMLFVGDIVKGEYNNHYDHAYFVVTYNSSLSAYQLECVAMHNDETGYLDISSGGYCNRSLSGRVDQSIEKVGDIYRNPEILELMYGQSAENVLEP